METRSASMYVILSKDKIKKNEEKEAIFEIIKLNFS